MKKIYFLVLAMVFVFGITAGAHAMTMYPEYYGPGEPILISDDYRGNYWAESKLHKFQHLIDKYKNNGGLPDLPDAYFKLDTGDLPEDVKDEKSGTLHFDADVIYVAIKGGRDAEFWYLNGAKELKFELSGGLSNLVAFTGKSEPVPEPMSVLLLGSGLIGLVGLKRFKLSKKT